MLLQFGGLLFSVKRGIGVYYSALNAKSRSNLVEETVTPTKGGREICTSLAVLVQNGYPSLTAGGRPTPVGYIPLRSLLRRG